MSEALASRRAAGTGHEDPQPDTDPSQLWFAVKYGRLCVKLSKEKEGPSGGGFGGNPKPKLRIAGVVGAGLHADASAR